MVRFLVFIVAIVALGPVATSAQSRVDLYDRQSNRTGGIIVDERTGRIDVYDRDANPLGYGQVNRTTGRVDLFDVQGNRVGNVTLTPSGGIRSISPPRKCLICRRR